MWCIFGVDSITVSLFIHDDEEIKMIRRIFIIIAIILLIGALKWESYGTHLITLSITILISIILLSMLRGCRGPGLADWLLDPIFKKSGGKKNG